MKFTNGFWLVRDEFQADYVRDIYEVEERENELLAFAPYKQIQGRGDTLNIGMMTYTFTAPAKDILGIHMVNHAVLWRWKGAYLYQEQNYGNDASQTRHELSGLRT